MCGQPVELEEIRKHVAARVFEDISGSIYALIYYKGKLTAYLELHPWHFENTWRFFVCGVTVDGKPFMECGLDEMCIDDVEEAVVNMMSRAILYGRFTDLAYKHKTYRVKLGTVLRKLEEAEQKLQMMEEKRGGMDG